jgi:hypothetical protein
LLILDEWNQQDTGALERPFLDPGSRESTGQVFQDAVVAIKPALYLRVALEQGGFVPLESTAALVFPVIARVPDTPDDRGRRGSDHYGQNQCVSHTAPPRSACCNARITEALEMACILANWP